MTEPERFLPLCHWALETVARLEQDYEVTREDGEGIDAELENRAISRPTIKLTPLRDSGAPVNVVFNDFPGLAVRVGRWGTDWFPSCGCDACDEMPEEEFERFEELLDDVVAGRFRESLSHGPNGEGWSRYEHWSDRGFSNSGGSRLTREETVQILNGKPEFVAKWMPWPKKSERAPTP